MKMNRRLSTFVFCILWILFFRRRVSAVVISDYAAAIKSMTRQSYDFSKMASGTKLKCGTYQLNKHNLRLNTVLAAELAPLLGDDTLANRMQVWDKTAEYARSWSDFPDREVSDVRDLDLFEGDIKLTLEQITERVEDLKHEKRPSGSEGKSRVKRKLTTSPGLQWGTVINWKYNSKFNSLEKRVIQQGLDFWASKTCLKFIEKTGVSRGPHLKFVKKSGCWSSVGIQRSGQEISIGSGCFSFKTVTHEIGHALGMWHEQSRPDRDNYVKVYPLNAAKKNRHNFGKQSWTSTRALGVPYDYGSVMHYTSTAFSTNGKPTVNPVKSDYLKTIGQRNGPSFYDIKMINLRYCSNQCTKTTPTLEWSFCKNDGYRDPKSCSKCMCPEGFKPPFCAGLDTVAKCGLASIIQATFSWQYLNSPGWPYRYPGPLNCTWKISAPYGSVIHLNFERDFSVGYCSIPCSEYVEIRDGDLSVTGKRFCCGGVPSYSSLPERTSILMILFHTKYGSQRAGFRVKYKTSPCGGCSATSRVAFACTKTERYSCPTVVNEQCGWFRYCRRIIRSNTCFRTKLTCCANFVLSGIYCLKKGTGLATPPPPTTPAPVRTPPPPIRTQRPPIRTQRPPIRTPRPYEQWGPWSSWECENKIRSRTCHDKNRICLSREYELSSKAVVFQLKGGDVSIFLEHAIRVDEAIFASESA